MKSARLAVAAQWLVIALIFIEPTGFELVGSITRWDPVPGWETTWSPPADLAAAIATYTSTDDLGGAGEFLQQQMDQSGPFRYAGYGGVTYPGQKNGDRTYTGRRAEPEIAAMLVNGRSIFLHIHDMQGYNPIQLSRYTEYIRALNTVPQDYHLANLRPQGIGSPLLNALNVRFILVDARIPPDRDDVLAIAQGRPPVFETSLIRVYENPTVSPHAWIVHETITATRAETVDLLANPDLNPSAVAFVESNDVHTEPAASGAVESATITRYDPERITIIATAGSAGLLVTSEIVESGWRATVDGEPLPIIPVNIALRGVEIPAGSHIIEFRYEPPSLRVGLIISILAHGLLALLLVATEVNRRSAQTTENLRPQQVL